MSRETYDAIHELIDYIEEATGGRITVQKAVKAGLGLFYTAAREMMDDRRIKPPPAELQAAALPYLRHFRRPRLKRVSRIRKSNKEPV
jgi:hypothetical protein